VSGVSVGLARHLGAPVSAIRALFVAATAVAGAGVLLYVWCWAFMPSEATARDRSRSVPVAWVLTAGAVVGLLGVSIAMGDPWGASWIIAPALPYGMPWLLGAAVAATVALSVAAGLWASFVDRVDPARGPRHAIAVRLAAAAVLVVTFFVPLDRLRFDGTDVLLIVLLPLGGLVVLASTTLVEKLRDLSGERVRRIREEQRSEMAAHLHDSVLQTLALIQNRAGASSEAARLARAQERELRAWLYDGDTPADSDLPTDLRDYAAALELDYPARIDVVSAGLSAERASGEVAAAAREAMLNAARHAGSEVSVYIEGRAEGVDVYVRDRGEGFALESVPGDRLGVRQSIIGRMRRAGGTATLRSTGDGTEVHLRFDRESTGAGDARG